ncbi:MAG: chemotaxis protein CheW [Thermodesulfovibrionales bacterium]|nr:chemotaxis protein CheW [Thermodesulfovibrionales bacterium]
MMKEISLLVYRIDEIRYAIPIHLVKKVIRMVEITPIPQASDKIMGIINYYGEVVPIINMRIVLNLKQRDIDISDQILIVRTEERTIGLWIDEVINIEQYPIDDIVNTSKTLKSDEHVLDALKGCIRLDDGLIVIHSVETFISGSDRQILNGLQDFVHEEDTR